jgi:hypothetical protein
MLSFFATDSLNLSKHTRKMPRNTQLQAVVWPLRDGRKPYPSQVVHFSVASARTSDWFHSIFFFYLLYFAFFVQNGLSDIHPRITSFFVY